jgi:outer membrane protein assembly factor BamA
VETPVRGGVRGEVSVLLSGAEVSRFYGFGNETPEDGPEDSFKARRGEARVSTLLSWSPREGLDLEAGPSLHVLRPDANPGTVLEELSPYGYRDFARLALVGRAVLDRRDDQLAPRHGGSLEVEGRWAPEGLDVDYAYGGVKGSATAYLSHDDIGLRPSLALRAGGEKLWGTYPYFEAAYLGGPGSVRGFRNGRFAGDASLWANAEVRFFLTHFIFLLPGDLGAFALGDVGRVFLEGEESDRWHGAAGGGLWVSWVRAYTASLALARAAGGTSVYFTLGLPF